ncbi:hypothetical protein [Aliikangiella maris]|uniref:DUF5666 domain-containing protein n=2 Tax=Aliikangiella maris TaxID=3162458 RepID=A0ABV3MN68_9GAMM
MSYPVNCDNVLLVNSVTASTTVNLVDNMQVATVKINTAAGLLGTITLSPVQPTATNIEYKAGEQVVQISSITFHAAFGLTEGQVSIVGNATNQQGADTAPYSKQICSWSN